MEYTKLGNSDLTVSRICMGCMGFGDPHTGQHSWTIDEEHSREVLQQALELGINFFDTAIGYQNGTAKPIWAGRCGTSPNGKTWWWPPNSPAAPQRRSRQV